MKLENYEKATKLIKKIEQDKENANHLEELLIRLRGESELIAGRMQSFVEKTGTYVGDCVIIPSALFDDLLQRCKGYYLNEKEILKKELETL